MAMNMWSTKVHDYSLRTNRGLSPQEAIALFGTPVGEVSASKILNDCMQDGWFRRETWDEEGALKVVRRSRYWAIQKQPRPPRAPDASNSWFEGLKRVRSVFELGDSL